MARLAVRIRRQGFTLVEVMVAVSILLILATMAIPLARVKIKREKEAELRSALREIRTAIDRYKDAADRNLIKFDADTEGYPPSLEILTEPIELASDPDHHVRFLRRIPVDPMTNSVDWGLRGSDDPPDSFAWSGTNVFDVYTRSIGVGLDGTPYRDW